MLLNMTWMTQLWLQSHEDWLHAREFHNVWRVVTMQTNVGHEKILFGKKFIRTFSGNIFCRSNHLLSMRPTFVYTCFINACNIIPTWRHCTQHFAICCVVLAVDFTVCLVISSLGGLWDHFVMVNLYRVNWWLDCLLFLDFIYFVVHCLACNIIRNVAVTCNIWSLYCVCVCAAWWNFLYECWLNHFTFVWWTNTVKLTI